MKVTLDAPFYTRKRKQIAAIAFDVGICVLCVWLAFYLRLGTNNGAAQKIYISGLSVQLQSQCLQSGFLQCHFRYNGIAALSLLRASICMEWFCYSRSDDWNTQCSKNNRINSADLIVFINRQLKNYAVHLFCEIYGTSKKAHEFK